MTDDIVARLRDCTCVPHGEICRAAADEIERLREERNEAEPLLNELWERRTEATEMRSEIERLRARVAELERFASELDASGRKHTEPAALRGTPSDGEASASEGYLHTGASVQTEKAEG